MIAPPSKLVTPPSNMIEYLARYSAHNRLSGRGIETTCHVPCPFCAAKDFMSYRLIDVRKIMAEDHICPACQRGAKAIFRTQHEGATSIEVVQTSGPEPPAWLTPPMRRV